MPSRRRLLISGCGLLSGLAGCGSDADNQTPTPTDTRTAGTDAAVSLLLDRAAYRFSATSIPRAVIGPREHEVTTLAELNDPTRTAVETAITDGRYTTTDPETALLNGIEGVSLVEYRGIYYEVSHTFPTHTLVLDTSVAGENAPEDRTVSLDSKAVRGKETVEKALTTISPSPSSDGDPYVTTRLSAELNAFLDEYDYLRYPGGVGELVLSRTRRAPPHSVTATEASDERLYDRRVYALDAFTETSRKLMRKTLQDRRKTPFWEETGDHSVFPVDVPQQLLDADHVTVHIDGTMYGFDADHVHWADLPFEVFATLVDDSLGGDARARIELTATNQWPDAAKLSMSGIAPFGILRAYGPGGEHLLWTPEYEGTNDVRREGGVLRPVRREDVLVRPEESARTVYEFGYEDDRIDSGTYVVPGVVWAKWPTEPHQNQPEYDWRSEIFPYRITLDVGK